MKRLISKYKPFMRLFFKCPAVVCRLNYGGTFIWLSLICLDLFSHLVNTFSFKIREEKINSTSFLQKPNQEFLGRHILTLLQRVILWLNR